jgi:hypothetical protein
MMMSITARVLAFSMLTALGLAACAPRTAPRSASPPAAPAARPDLVPMNRATTEAPGPFCNIDRRVAVPKLIVSVRNQGAVEAPPSTTTVGFSTGGDILQLPTPRVPAGGAVDLAPVTLPIACFNPHCEFKITVDAANTVNEGNAGNNVARGRCNG